LNAQFGGRTLTMNVNTVIRYVSVCS